MIGNHARDHWPQPGQLVHRKKIDVSAIGGSFNHAAPGWTTIGSGANLLKIDYTPQVDSIALCSLQAIGTNNTLAALWGVGLYDATSASFISTMAFHQFVATYIITAITSGYMELTAGVQLQLKGQISVSAGSTALYHPAEQTHMEILVFMKP